MRKLFITMLLSALVVGFAVYAVNGMNSADNEALEETETETVSLQSYWEELKAEKGSDAFSLEEIYKRTAELLVSGKSLAVKHNYFVDCFYYGKKLLFNTGDIEHYGGYVTDKETGERVFVEMQSGERENFIIDDCDERSVYLGFIAALTQCFENDINCPMVKDTIVRSGIGDLWIFTFYNGYKSSGAETLEDYIKNGLMTEDFYENYITVEFTWPYLDPVKNDKDTDLYGDLVAYLKQISQ